MSNAIKRVIAKHKEKKARRNLEKDSKYIVDDIDRISSAFQQYGIFGRYCNGPDEDATEDDASSVSSFSTTATTDDNPGAGYTIDKYFYQPVGRRIEKFAFRIAMPLLSPFRIFQYIEQHHFNGWLYYIPLTYPPYRINLKNVYLAGLESLVHQTRSNSLMRSSAALSAIIRLCPMDVNISGFFYRDLKQIGHPRLALLLIDSDAQEKKCYLFLMTLIWARPGLSEDGLRHCRNNNYTEISRSYLIETLLKLVNSWRNPNKDAFAIMSEASLCFTQALSPEKLLMHMDQSRAENFELVYFFTIFIVRLIPFIYNNSTRHTCRQQTQHLFHLLLLTFLRWLDSALFKVVCTLHWDMKWMSKPHMLQTKLAIDSLLLHDPIFATLLPASTGLLSSNTGLLEKLLPRNQRHRGKHLTITDIFIRASISRTQHLLMSLDELEREIRDSKSRPIAEEKEMSSDEYEYTLSQARCVNVFQSEATEEFLRARRNEFWRDWLNYKQRCQARHEWGIYLRSNLDWDWDTTNYLQRLFEIPEEAIAPTAPIATVSFDTGKADTWNVTTESRLPKEVKFAYKSATGETKYKTIMIGPSLDDIASASGLAHVVEEQDKTSPISPDPRGGGFEGAEHRSGVVTYENNDAAPMSETDFELGVKQVTEKQEEVLLIPEMTQSGGAEEVREESEVIVAHENNDAPSAEEMERGVKGSGDGDNTADDDGMEELMKNLALYQEQQFNQISIGSLD